jgi:uncharacterized membrane protein YgcG
VRNPVKKSSNYRVSLNAAVVVGAALAAPLSFWSVSVQADPPTSPPMMLAQAGADDVPIYGSQLMTEQERADYRARWRAAVNDEERTRLRTEHHERMKDRARERGVTLPEEPPARGAGSGPGPRSGGGGGTGPGGGGGSGPGPGPGPR